MIHYLKRNQLDETKYNNCIKSSLNSRIYAFSWYLDIVSDNWDALVLNDYEAVMPLPWRQKYFIKYIYPPAWTQQLGVFSNDAINAVLVKQFVNSIPKKFKKVTIQFNAENDLSLLKTTKRINYILYLNKPYEEIYNGFNKNRKRDFKMVDTLKYTLNKRLDVMEFLEFYLNESKNYQLNKNHIIKLKALLNSNLNAVTIWGIRDQEKLVASLILLKDYNRITYFLPIVTQKAKGKGLPTFLVSKLIQEYQNSNLILDFEGSMIKGVADYYKSFGAIEEEYFVFQKTFRLFKKRL